MKSLSRLCLILSCVFGFERGYSEETHSFCLPREYGTCLEGYFLPPTTSSSPIVFAIQGSSSESAFNWYVALSKQMSLLGLGLIVLEKQGVSRDSIDHYEYNQSNCLENRYQDYQHCLESLYATSPDWKGPVIFLGESEGGMLAANLASQTPETAAVLLFATGGGMKPSEEAKWTIRNRLERHNAPQDQVDEYMYFLDEQMDAMMLDSSPNKQFLGNTYKWWASLLSENEASSSLSNCSFPIYLVHGVEDDKIPVLSADLAVEILEKTNTLTYLRLEGYGHNLNYPDIRMAACAWLESVIFKQDTGDVSQIASVDFSPAHSQEDWKDDISEYVLSRDGNNINIYGNASTDREGNQQASGNIALSREFDDGSHLRGKASVSTSQIYGQEVKAKAEAEISWNKDF